MILQVSLDTLSQPPIPSSKPYSETAGSMKHASHPYQTLPLPLNFNAPETFTLNPDPRIPLAYAEVKKTLHLRTLAENIPDGFYSGPNISRNPPHGSGNILPKLKALLGPIYAFKLQQ